MQTKTIKILYTNWRGETAWRRIEPIEIIFSSNEWHPQEQWLLLAHDLEKDAKRTFACKDIKEWVA